MIKQLVELLDWGTVDRFQNIIESTLTYFICEEESKLPSWMKKILVKTEERIRDERLNEGGVFSIITIWLGNVLVADEDYLRGIWEGLSILNVREEENLRRRVRRVHCWTIHHKNSIEVLHKPLLTLLEVISCIRIREGVSSHTFYSNIVNDVKLIVYNR